MTADPQQPPWAMVSELSVDPEGAEALEEAFRNRLGEVENHEGFVRLEVWRDPRRAGRYLMVSWWTTREAFSAWMHSESHDRSHDRMPKDFPPKPVRFDRYEIVAR